MSHSSSSPGLELAFSTTENQSQEDLSEEKKIILRSNKFLSNLHMCAVHTADPKRVHERITHIRKANLKKSGSVLKKKKY